MSQFFMSGGQSIWSFSFSISPSNEYLVLISFRIDWFYLLAVPGTFNTTVQSINSSVLKFLTQYPGFSFLGEKGPRAGDGVGRGSQLLAFPGGKDALRIPESPLDCREIKS